MKILKLDLKNFVRFPKLSIEFDRPVTAIVGDNGEGKSTVIDAVETLFRGTSRGLSRQQAKALSCWSDPEKGWSIDGQVAFGEQEGRIRRTQTTLSAFDAEGVRHQMNQQAIESVAPQKVMAALLDVWKALDMSPEQRKALFYDLLAISMDGDDLFERGLVDAEVRALAEAGEWKKAETLSATKKREVGRELKKRQTLLGTHEKTMEAADDFTLDGEVHKASEVTARDLDVVERLHREADYQRRRATERIDRLKSAPTTVEERLKEIDDELSGMESEEHYTAGAKRLRTDEEDMRKAMEEARRAVAEHASVVGELEAEERRLQGHLKPRKAHECKTCHLQHEWPEGFDAAPIEARLKELDGELRESRDMEGGANQFLAENEEKVQRLTAEAKAHEDSADTVRSLSGEAARLVKTDESLEGLHADQKKHDDMCAVLGPIIDRMKVALATQEALVTLTAEVKAMENRVESYKVQEHLCRPDGLVTQSLAGKMGPVRERMEAVSMRLFVREAELKGPIGINFITIDDECNIRCSLHNGSIMPVESVSHSSRWRASLAVADAIAWASGMKWLAIDETNVLDLHTRAGFLDAVVDLAADYDQIILCLTTNDPEGPVQPPIDEVRVLWAKGGEIENAPGAA